MTDDILHVALIQTDLVWEDRAANRQHLEHLFLQLPGRTDLVILPEMFSTGFSMKAFEFAESMDGETVTWMKNQASRYQTVIAGSLMVREDDRSLNRFVFVYPAGEVHFYDKRHLFSMGLENSTFTPGSDRKVFLLKEFRIFPQVCYDLRFPVFSRNRDEYDVLINCANWPASRREVWETLLKARAIENQVYVLGVNRTGTDGNGIHYSGNSLIIDPKGKEMASAAPGKEAILTARFSRSSLDQFRRRFPVLNDRDNFTLHL